MPRPVNAMVKRHPGDGPACSWRRSAQTKMQFSYPQTKPHEMTDREGASAFYRDQSGDIFHTYSTFARGIDLLNTTYNFLDLTAKGRDEDPEASQDWVRYHDEYPKSKGLDKRHQSRAARR